MSLIRPINLPTLFSSQDYVFDIYRGDLEHPSAPGNKWHKLQYHLEEAEKRKATVIATFGGPFSNHLHAFGATLKDLPFKAIAVVRGELHPILTLTLKDAVSCGVELWPSSRSDYRLAENSEIVQTINKLHDNIYWIPEGGGGELGALGCRDWAEQIHNLETRYDAWVLSAGTGTTAAGFLAFDDLNNTPDLHVFSALKGVEKQREEVIGLAYQVAGNSYSKEALSEKLFFHSDCHEGGYAKHSQELIEFIKAFAMVNPDTPLDPVYTSKSMFAVLSSMNQGTWSYSRTLFIHTGGLQGWRGYAKESNPFTLL